MGIFDSIATRLGYAKAPRNSVAPHIVEMARVNAPYVDKRNLWHNQAEAYQVSSWLYKAVATLSRSAALVSMHVYQVTGDGTREGVDNHPLELLLRKPNPFWSRFEFLEGTFAQLALNGNAFWYLRPTLAETIGELWPLRPDRVTVVPSETEFVAGYVYEVEGRKVPLDASEVAHFKFFHPLQDYIGLSPVEPLSYAIATDSAAQKWQNAFFQNSARPDLMISTGEPISQADFERLRKDWEHNYKGTGNAHKVAFLSHGFEPKPLSVSPKELDFVSGRQMNREEIWQIMSVPMGMWSENATEANATVALQTFYNFGLWPMLCCVHDKCTSSILPRYGEGLVAEFDDVRVTDRRLEMEEIRLFLRSHTINEARSEHYDADPIEGGDVIVTEGGQIVLGADKPEPQPIPAGLLGAQQDAVAQEQEEPEEDNAAMAEAQKAEMKRWEKWAVARVKDGRWPPERPFERKSIDDGVAAQVDERLASVTTAQEVKAAFAAPFCAYP